MMNDLMDDDGENRALRYFLAYYGGSNGVTVGKMQANLRMTGFDGAWPAWCNEPNKDKQHLTKGGAQLWIRHLLSLEPKAAQPVAQDVDWKDQYEKQKRRAEMWIAKYEKDIGPLEKAQPVAQPLTDDVVRALWQQTLDATKGPLPIEEFASVLAKHYGIGAKE